MARKRKNRHRNRSEAAQLKRQYQYRSQLTEEMLRNERYRESQSEYMKVVQQKVREAAETTVFISNVADLKVETNLIGLRQFLNQTYGPVSFCRKHHFDGRRRRSSYPPALVRFVHGRDAARIFGVDSLLGVDNKSARVTCNMGHRGYILVFPYRHTEEIAREDMTSAVVEFSSQRVSFGHWHPPQEENDREGVWLEVEIAKEGVPRQSDDGVETAMDQLFNGLFAGMGTSKKCVSASGTDASLALQIDLVKREVRLIHRIATETDIMTVRFKQLESPMRLYRDQNATLSLIFSLKYPPTIEKEEVNPLFSDMQRSRQTKWAAVQARTFGTCLGYKVFLPESTELALQQHEKSRQLKNFGVLDLGDCHKIESRFIGWEDEGRWTSLLTSVEHVRPRILLCALKDAGCFCAYDAINEATRTIFDVVNEHQTHRAEKALETMKGQRTKTRSPCALFLEIVESIEGDEPGQILPDHCVSLPKLILTPTRVAVIGFEVETSNRAIRLFHNLHNFPLESFARVQIVDENMGSIFSRDITLPIEDRLRLILNDGPIVAGERFAFLAYSSSQLREASFWVVAIPRQSNIRSVKTMRSKLGRIEEKSVAKYAARLGQCFSTTFCQPQKTAGPSVPFSYYKELDIERGRYCFSDGTGLISRSAMDRLLCSVPFAPKDPLDTGIVQIRFKGAKGTLVAWENPSSFIPGASGKDIVLRDSMIKFDSEHKDVEVCSIGKAVPYHLNRNVVFLLVSQGVPTSVFVDLQNEMLDMLDGMLDSTSVALQVLPRLSGIESGRKGLLLHMLLAGFSPRTEPFLYSSLVAIRCHHLSDLRKKSRIYVEKGAVLMGGIDETGLLKGGTVFIQIKEGSGESAKYKPLIGPVLVTKHPVMHPGDLRMLRAVDVPALRNCRNAILFSQEGQRPEADKMSGSDYDGDEFAVTWDERLFLGNWNACTQYGPDRYRSNNGIELHLSDLDTANVEPMDFSPSERESRNNVPDDDEEVSAALIDHLLDYMKNASVGQICSLWWDHASKDGAVCDVCLHLARIHSIAVDYPKSGIPAEIPAEYRWKDRPRAHWREKKGPSFHCTSVIGRLYDDVISRLNEARHESRNTVAVADRQKDKYGTILCSAPRLLRRASDTRYYLKAIPHKLGLQSDPESQRLVSMAIYQRSLYNQELLQLMNTHGVRGEGEVYTGCVRKYHKLHKKRQNEFLQDIRRRQGILHNQHRRLFFRLVVTLAMERKSRMGNELDSQRYRTSSRAYETDNSNLPDDNEDAEEEFDETDEEMVHRLFLEENEALEKDSKMAEEVVTLANTTRAVSSEEDFDFKSIAFRLAGAWYEAAYSPELQDSSTLLFGFPWIVADVIARCVTAP